MLVWEPSKKMLRKPTRDEVFEAVYALTMLIPLSKVTTYKDIASLLGISPRTVGYALKKNEKPLIIPCHRVVGSNGELKGYSLGGPVLKRKILELEGVKFRGSRVDESCIISADHLVDC